MNKKNRNKIIMIVLGIIVLLIGIYVVLCNHNEKVLREEINNTVSMKIDSKYKVECRTIFGYCDVEEAIKNYLSDYSIKLNNIKKVSSDENIINVLSVSNYKTDGPKFDKSIKYLKDTLSSYDKDIDSLIVMSDKQYLNDYIKKYTKSKRYIKLYKDVINDENVYSVLDNTNELKTNKKNVDNTISWSIKTLEFLKKNPKQWKIEKNKLKFNNYKYLDKYNAYLKKLK